jgi:hypothetical protein
MKKESANFNSKLSRPQPLSLKTKSINKKLDPTKTQINSLRMKFKLKSTSESHWKRRFQDLNNKLSYWRQREDLQTGQKKRR